jgi:hypothetical protein
LFDYWNSQRRGRPAPERGDIEPGPIRRALADTYILAFDRKALHPVRLAGTRMCAMFGRELNGVRFLSLWGNDSRGAVGEMLDVVATEAISVVAGAVGTAATGATLELELLVLPLAYRGRHDVRVLGTLAPLTVPAWFGLDPFSSISLGTLRYLDPATALTPDFVPGSADRGRRRRGLVVYDGGRT